jgi:hypothetical protein
VPCCIEGLSRYPRTQQPSTYYYRNLGWRNSTGLIILKIRTVICSKVKFLSSVCFFVVLKNIFSGNLLRADNGLWKFETFVEFRHTYLTLESELLYDWRFSTNQFVLTSSSLRTHEKRFFTTFLRSWSLCNIFSDDRWGLSFMNRLGLCQVYVPHI